MPSNTRLTRKAGVIADRSATTTASPNSAKSTTWLRLSATTTIASAKSSTLALGSTRWSKPSLRASSSVYTLRSMAPVTPVIVRATKSGRPRRDHRFVIGAAEALAWESIGGPAHLPGQNAQGKDDHENQA